MFPVSAGQLVLTSVVAVSNYLTVYNGTITGGGTNLFAGGLAYITGFVKNGGVNNSGVDGFQIVSNTTTTLTVKNANGVSETAPGNLWVFTVNAAGPEAGAGPFGTSPSTLAAQGGLNDVPDAPSGVNLANYNTGWNYTNSKTSTQNLLTALTAARNSQTPWSVIYGTADPPTPPGFNIAETTPAAPTGSFTQSGLPYQTNASQVLLAGMKGSDLSYYTGKP